MTRPAKDIHEPTLPIHEPFGTALRQAYDYWQDQPGFPNPELQSFKVPGPKSAVLGR